MSTTCARRARRTAFVLRSPHAHAAHQIGRCAARAADAGRARGADGRRSARPRPRHAAPARAAEAQHRCPGLCRAAAAPGAGARALRRRGGGLRRRRDARYRTGRGRGDRGYVRAAAGPDRRRGGDRGRCAGDLGRQSRQRGVLSRIRRQGRGRCGTAARRPCRAPHHRHQPRHRQLDGAARLHRRTGTRPTSATPSAAPSSRGTARARRWPASSRRRTTSSACCATTWAAASA